MHADTHFKRLMESIYLYQTNIQVFLQVKKNNFYFYHNHFFLSNFWQCGMLPFGEWV